MFCLLEKRSVTEANDVSECKKNEEKTQHSSSDVINNAPVSVTL